MLIKGQRVQTPLGAGTILGFEHFNSKGWPHPPRDTDPDNGFRVMVRLDDPTLWIPTEQSPHPYIFRSQLSALKEGT